MSETPITRVEKLTAAIVNGNVINEKGIPRMAHYLKCIMEGTTATEVPQTRAEHYLAKIAGMDVQLEKPVTRLEKYLASIAGLSVDLPAPVTRLEHLLYDWAEASATISGRSVVWGQMVNPASPYINGTHNGITYSIDSDGVLTIQGTLAQGAVNTYRPIVGTGNDGIKLNHKYYGSVGNKNSAFTVWHNASEVLIKNEGIFDCKVIGNGVYVYLKDISGGYVVNETLRPQLFDLTAMFGTTVADAMYSAEQQTAGAGVAMFKALFPEDYYPYSEPTLVSLNRNTYSLFGLKSWHYGDLELRGVPKITDGAITFDGDVYEGGVVTRNFGTVDLGTLTWYADPNRAGVFYSATLQTKTFANAPLLCAKYASRYTGVPDPNNLESANKQISLYQSYGGGYVYVVDLDYASATPAEFKTAMSGVNLIYQLATPTEETT